VISPFIFDMFEAAKLDPAVNADFEVLFLFGLKALIEFIV